MIATNLTVSVTPVAGNFKRSAMIISAMTFATHIQIQIRIRTMIIVRRTRQKRKTATVPAV